MAELVDAPASGAGDRKVVEVRVLFWAPFVLHEHPDKSKIPLETAVFLCLASTGFHPWVWASKVSKGISVGIGRQGRRRYPHGTFIPCSDQGEAS